ncbi:MAG: gamma-glutamyltransferase family protein [Alphaproteobacteria bacterium]
MTPPFAPPSLAHRPVVMGDRGMVVAGHHRAAEAGVAMLRAGGNAIDGAVATAATLAIAIPFMNGLGGDAIALYARAPDDVVTINGSGAVARGASVAAIRAHGHATMPMRGPFAVSTPGFVAAMGEAAARYGTLPFAQLLEPAIALAEEGVPMDASALGFFNGPVYAALAAEYPALAQMFGPPGGRVLGERLKQPMAARTLRRLAADGWRAFYEGPLARDWLAAGRAAGILLDASDLADHATAFVPALSMPWRGRHVHAAPPNSQGLALLAMLRLAEMAPDRPASEPLLDPNGHLARKVRAFALRDAYCADPRRIALPADVLEPARLAATAPDLATMALAGGGDTSTFVVVDRDGRAVSWVQSLFEEFGSGVAVPEHGIVLHNRAGLERLDDDPVHGLKGGYRPFHTLCPAIATGPEDGAVTTLATPGDHGQPQSLALVLRRLVEQGLDIQAAIEWPRLRHDTGTDVMLEDRCPPEWDAALAASGWAPRRVGPWSRLMGGVNGIVRRADGLAMGGGDPRRSSYALAA